MNILICKSCGGNLKKEGKNYVCLNCGSMYECDVETSIQTQAKTTVVKHRNSNSKTIAFCGIMTAFIFVVLLLETYALAGILPYTPCFLSLPIAISLCLFEDWRKEFIGGTIIGCCSLCIALTNPGLFAPFLNPLISILPRVLLGIVAFWTYKGLNLLFSKISIKHNKINNKFWCEVFPLAVAGAVGVLVNTLGVLSMITAFYGGDLMASILQTVIAFNFIPEILCGIILVPVYVVAIKRFQGTSKKYPLEMIDTSNITK